MDNAFARLVLTSMFVTFISISASAGTRVLAKEKMSFSKCLAIIRGMANKLGVAPINIIETNILRMVRFKTNDGSGKSYLITCSKPDRTMLMNESW